MELNNNKGKRMPKPYSEDLRERVLKIVDEKRMTMEAVSEMFKIDRKTIDWWKKRREETGSIKPSFGYQKGHSHKIKYLDSLVKFMDVKRDIKVEKIIEEFGNMCKDTVYNYLKKVNYTYKKTFLLTRRRLNYKQFCGLQSKQPWQVKEYNYWQTTRQKLEEFVRENITKQFEEWRNKFSKEKIEEKRQESLNDIREKIGTLNFTRSSPEIREICDRIYDRIRSDYINQHGLLSWGWYSTVSCDVHREIIGPQIPELIADLKVQKKAACHKQLSKLFEDELAELSGQEASQLIDKFLEDNYQPLRERLVYYDRTQVAKKIKEIYPEHMLNIVDRALNNSLSAINEVIDCETEKALKEHESS